jgi:hypothetical protein
MTTENLTDSKTALEIASQRLSNMATWLYPSPEAALMTMPVLLMVAFMFYLTFAGSKSPTSSRKAQQAKAMRDAYKSMEQEASLSDSKNIKVRSSLETLISQQAA